MRKRIISTLLCLVMVLGLVPATTFATGLDAEDDGDSIIYVDAIDGDDDNEDVGTSWETAYKTLSMAVENAESGSTIMLSAAKYTLYGSVSTEGKDLTFVGQGTDDEGTIWNIGAEIDWDADFDSDNSFDGAGTVTFKDMLMQTGDTDGLGFVGVDETVVENCVINGKTSYWGTTATFTDTEFNCPEDDYCILTEGSDEITFDTCTFNADGYVIKAYRESVDEDSVGESAENPIKISLKDCNVKSDKAEKAVVDINDSTAFYEVSFSGENTVKGLDVNEYTCSKLFSVEGLADGYNLTEAAEGNDISKQATVIVDGDTVWEDGKMTSHELTDGENDDAFTVTWGEWSEGEDGTQSHDGKRVCDYCGYTEEVKDTKDAVSDDNNNENDAIMDDEPIVLDGEEDKKDEAEASVIYVDAKNGNDDNENVGTSWETAYKTLSKAVAKAKSGSTIMLSAANYTLYGINSAGSTKGKDLKFVGQGTGEDGTSWNIGAKVPNPDLYGTEYNGDYSFDGAGTVTFKNMVLRSGSENYLGFIRADKTVVEDCVINGLTYYWGYSSAMFKNCEFNCPKKDYVILSVYDYAVDAYSSDEMTFDNCTFNGGGKCVNVYGDAIKSGEPGSSADKPRVINLIDCTVNSSSSGKAVLNIKDNNAYYEVNISGNHNIKGLKTDKYTCSKLFQVEGLADGYNLTKGAKGNKKKTQATVSIDGEIVWKDGKMVSHDYTDGKKDNNIITTWGSWIAGRDGKMHRYGEEKCGYCGYSGLIEDTKDLELDVSRSKTATELNSKKQSKVTLSMPSAEEPFVSDVVFVIDGSSSAETDAVNKALELLDDLKESIESSEATVNVCVVKFKKRAYKSEWYNLATNYSDIETAMTTKHSEGSNIHSGLLAGQEALEEHTAVPANNKYLILISDGSTYLYNKDCNWDSETPNTRTYYTLANYNGFAGGFNDQGLYNPDNLACNVSRPKNTSDVIAWKEYFKDVEDRNKENNGDAYDYHFEYDNNINKGIPSKDFKSQPAKERSANNRDMAYYYANQTWQEIREAGYNVFSIATKDGSAGAGNSDDSKCFMNYLNDGASLDFDDIKREMLYAVGEGTTVEDKMGSEFDFVSDSMTLTVGGKELESKTVDNVTYFGDKKDELDESNYRFKVEYDSDEDKFTWFIGEIVYDYAPVQLSYNIKLANPSKTKGKYTVPTNEYAKLTPVDSLGNKYNALLFPVPTVTYKVSGSGSGGGEGSSTYYYFAIEKIDGEDNSTLKGAKFGIYLNGNQIATATSDKNGIALFTVAERDYKKINENSDLYYKELKAPAGYALNEDKEELEKTDFYCNDMDKAVKNAETVKNSLENIDTGYKVPEGLNGDDHVAYVHGYTDGTVKPNNNVTRAETATMLYHLLTDSRRNEIQTVINGFSDVSADNWYNEYVSSMANGKYIMGYPDGTFGGDKTITRAEFVAMLVRFIGVQEDECSFTDVSRSHWAYGCIATATKANWISGYPDGTFKPEQPITRAEAMSIINRVLNRGVNENSELLNFKVWPDNEPWAWYYYEVIEASNEHEYTGARPSENWTKVGIN